MTQVTPGIHWIKLPIGMADSTLEHINVYLIEGRQGYLLVDTGWNTVESFAALQKGMAAVGADLKDISQILVTHVHPDHFGLAGRLKEISGATIAMHDIEKGFITSRYVDMEELLRQTDRLLVASGVPEGEMVKMRDATVGLEHYIVPAPPDILLHDGDTVDTGAFTFRVIWTPGHSSGHICLYEPAKKVFLSGDHVLPKITPNIGVHPQSIENPLGRYLKSLQELRRLDIELALPGHDMPFTNFKSRIDEITRHHHQRNSEILEAIARRPLAPYAIAQEVTWGDNSGWQSLPAFHQRMAIFETLAHLEMMATDSRVSKFSKNGVTYYRQK